MIMCSECSKCFHYVKDLHEGGKTKTNLKNEICAFSLKRQM